MKPIILKCPGCSAILEIDKDRKQAFCPYCGTKLSLYDENEYTININEIYRDEARIRELEIYKQEQYEKHKVIEEKEQTRKRRLKISLYIVLFSVILAIIGHVGAYFTPDTDITFYSFILLGWSTAIIAGTIAIVFYIPRIDRK